MVLPDAVEVSSEGPVTTSTRRVRVVVVRPGERVEEVAARHPGATPSFNRTLRVALAMRGGVSLAVWIGGAVAELDLLRRIRLHDVGDETLALVPETAERPLTPPVLARLQAYAEFLDAAGYDRVEFDLLAGASAGGLNAVVYAVAQRAGTGLDGLLRVWGRVGGFWGLLHPPGARGILALMQGEDYFRAQTLTALRDIYDTTDRHPDLVSPYTGVDLSATVIDARDEFEEDANEGRGHFHFVGSDEHLLDNRIPRRLDDLDETRLSDDHASLSRLALAARSTSSLPGGFEPAQIDSTTGAAGEPQDAEARGMRFAFAAHRDEPGTPYRIVDGAVFDNVPIERALRSARSRVSDRRADRVMLFLDPEPDPPVGGATEWDPNASRFFRAIGAMVSRQFRRESVAREVAELERFNAEREVAAARLDSAAPLIAAASWSHDAIHERRRAYVRALGTDLAEHLAATVSAPSLWQLTSSLPGRRRYRPIPRIRLTGLAAVASERFGSLRVAETTAVSRSPLALADAANCVLAWARALEALPAERGSRRGLALTEVREAAYGALTQAIRWRDQLTARVLELTDEAAARDADPTGADFDAWVTTWLAASARIKAPEIWSQLDTAVARLRLLTARVEQEAEAGRRQLTPAWLGSAWRPLGATTALAAADLPPLYHSAGIPAALSHVRYWAIGVDEAPADPGGFRSLARDRWYGILGRVLRTPGITPARAAAEVRRASEHVALDRQSKLAGYGFGNFLGFLARAWRVNDWWWGRLDAAAGIARFFTALEPEAVMTDVAVRRLQDAVLAESDDPAVAAEGLSPLEPVTPAPGPAAVAGAAAADGATARAPRTRRERLRAGTDTILDLAPAYRFAIASRTVRLIDRVIVQPVGKGMWWIAQALLALVRPLLVAVPAVFDPPRLALVAAFVAAVAWPLTWEPVELPEVGWLVGLSLVGAGAIVAIWAGVISTQRHWRRVAEAIGGELGGVAEAARIVARKRAYVMAGVATASVVPLVIALLQSNFLLIVLCVGVTAVLGAIAKRLASSARRTPVPGRDRRTIAMVVVFGLLGGVLPLVQLAWDLVGDLPPWLAPEERWNLLVLAVGAAAVTITLTVGWLRIGRTAAQVAATRGVDWITVTVASVAVGAGAHWLATDFFTIGIADLLADVIAAAAFIVAWANVVWWMPDLVRRIPEADDRVERAPLD
ncbi:putative acylesterase/phospholipase RssA [Agromyces flavus]|uniref:Acylesterase/phospholipase RssA n=1 Tax=Agromyces flavus TaxID=589382 RepID=A0A1H1LX51_9MICO|nr:DUF3376 domain-containing protein [Agromyces flavus]MCP2368662.1 putative acylesterase/phospholipase RssA [Agromyces flavus]GGI48098.1 hypothetical protein GCM10010932_27860 [Agromyces flavus]SDR79091.1 patatin-related protein [Agromyces flavus]